MSIFAAALPLVGKILDRVIPDPAARDAAKAKLIELEQAGEFRELDKRYEAISAEASSADPWTSRARPAFLYVMYIFLLMAIPMGILSAFQPEIAARISAGVTGFLDAIPEEFYALMGAGYLGYGGMRSWEKKKGIAGR